MVRKISKRKIFKIWLKNLKIIPKCFDYTVKSFIFLGKISFKIILNCIS